MPAAFYIYIAFIIEARLPAFHKAGELALGSDKIELGEQLLIVHQLMIMLRDSSRERLKYPCDLGLLFGIELPQLIIQVDH